MRLTGIGKRYGRGDWVLSGVDVALPGGEVVAVTGGNGVGKSTLLRVLVGLTRPTVGSVDGRPPVVGYVPDRFPQHDRMSARSYLAHLGRIRGLRTALAVRRADELLERLALVGGADTALRRLSRGNTQKVALAQALLVAPDLLVLDEPWSGLDASAHGVLAEIITEVGASGGCVVFTDHRESATSAYATRRYRIGGGRLTERAAGPDLARVELRRSGPYPLDLSGLSGVVDVREHERTVAVLVATDECDELLRTVLAHGWSVEGVRRPAAVSR